MCKSHIAILADSARRARGCGAFVTNLLPSRRAYPSTIGFSGGSVIRVWGADITGDDRLARISRAYDAATRHSSTCILLLEGVNPKSVALQMGWSSVAFMLENYARFMPGWGDDGVMDAALS